MVDASWDNGGQALVVKKGMPLWAKVLTGCGVVVLLTGLACGGLVYVTTRKLRNDPEGFKAAAMKLVVDQIRPEWEDFSAVVAQLRTPKGCQALYAANPELAKAWPTEADFLKAAATWRVDLAPLPELTPQLMDAHGLSLQSQFHGHVTLAWRPPTGPSVRVTFDRARKKGDTAPRKVVGLEVR